MRIAMIIFLGAFGLLSFTPVARGVCAGPVSCICPFDEAVLILEATVFEKGMFRVDKVVRKSTDGSADGGISVPMTPDGGFASVTQATSIDATPWPVPDYGVGDEFAIDAAISPQPSPGTRWLVGIQVGRWQTALPLDSAGNIVCSSAYERIGVEQLVSVIEGPVPCNIWAQQNLTSTPASNSCNDTNSSFGCSHAPSHSGRGPYCAAFIVVAALIRHSARRRKGR